MNTNRTISPITLDLAHAMATDPESTPALRAFHATNLEDLKRRAELQQRPLICSPFSRFEQSLEETTNPQLKIWQEKETLQGTR